MQTYQTPEDQLTIEELYVRASAGKRLANYIIDIIVFYFLLITAGILIALVSPSSINDATAESAGINLMERILSLFIYAIYMAVVEAIFKGKSVGKFITKTRAVNLDGSTISTRTAILRAFSRAVPFCVFSAFGNPCDPWQDRWTNTMVIEEIK